MRYQPKQELFVVQFAYDPEGERNRWYRLPMLHDNEQPTRINFNKLIVTEHHRVPGEWDNADVEPQYDGYLLKDEQGEPFSNQFPRASYGQTSDEGNRRFSLRLDSVEAYHEKEKANPRIAFEYHLLTSVMESMEKGIKQLSNIVDTVAEPEERKVRASEKLVELVTLRDRIYREFKEQYPQYELAIKQPETDFEVELSIFDVEIKKTYTSEEAVKLDHQDLVREVGQYRELTISLPGGNGLYIRQDSGKYLLMGMSEPEEVKNLQVGYLEKLSDHIWHVHGLEYFDPVDVDFAVCALMERVCGTTPEKISTVNDGNEECGSLERIYQTAQAAKAALAKAKETTVAQ